MASLRVTPATTAAVLFCAALFSVAADTAVATNAPDYVIQGRVYCDTCRAGFETNVTEYIKGMQLTSSLETRTDSISESMRS